MIERKGRRPQVFRLLRKTTMIGRGKDTDLLLPDISVSRHHAKIEQRGSDLVLVDLGSQNGTKVNGKPVKERVLESGDQLQVGKFVIVFEQKAARKVEGDPNEKNMPRYSLEGERTGFLQKVSALEGEGSHSTTQLSEDDLAVVRVAMRTQEHARIALANEPQTSWSIGNHGLRFGKGGVPASGMGLGGSARIEREGAALFIEKLGGLFFKITVNGEPVTERRSLQSGDAIVVGKTAFIYTA